MNDLPAPLDQEEAAADGPAGGEELWMEHPVPDRFPTGRQIGWGLFLFALVLYLASLSWTAFPGLPTQALLDHLDPTAAAPSALDSIWGWLVNGFAHLPGLAVAGWAGLFSALCGAAAVGLLGGLMGRVRYLIRSDPGRDSFAREAQARKLSAGVAGLYLACNIPFWMVSTRSLPGSFHLLLLVLAAWAFSRYQHGGRRRDLFGAGLLFGLGLTESATFIVFLPVAVFLLAREMFRWNSLGSWRAHAVLWGGLGLGLLLYPIHAAGLYREGVALGLFTSPWQAVFQVLADQFRLITMLRFHSGFLVIMFLSMVPWLMLFVLSHRSPWFYEWGQVGVRLIFIGGLLGVLFNASYAPWRWLGMQYVMVTPYLLLAAGMGYMAGEFWILGEPKALAEVPFLAQAARRSASLFALALPVAVLAAGAFHWRTVDGRHARIAKAAVSEVLGRLAGRDIVFSAGVLDDSLRLAVWERKIKVRVVSASRTSSPLYLRRLSQDFVKDTLREPLERGDFGTFLDNLLMSEEGPDRIGIIDLPEIFREFGYLVPDGFLYRLEATAEDIDLPALIESQRPFWARMERMARQPVPEANLVRPYQNQALLLASKIANNLAVMQVERGDEAGALETLRTARRIHPENLSVLLNLLELARTRELPESAELEAEWARRQEELKGERWALAVRFGYVWRAREWVKRGFVWALSGAPGTVEAARRQPSVSVDSTDAAAQLLDQAYLAWGASPRDEPFYRAQLMKDGRDAAALMALCRLALRRNDLEAAEAYIAEAMAAGLREEDALFDRAMADHVRGETGKALEALVALSRQFPGDERIWMAILLLSEREDPVNAAALKTLKDRGGANVPLRLALASVHLSRQQWVDAQAELEKAIQLDSRNTQAWEMMVTLAQERRNKALLDASLQALLARDPGHYLQYQNEGVAHYRKGDLEKAEASFRKGLQRHRDPTLLNNLAHVVMERGGDLPEALQLVDEALKRKPGTAAFFSTRGAIYLKMGRFGEARDDFQEAMKRQGRSENLLLQLVRSYEGMGDRARAFTMAKALALQPDRLDAGQKSELKEMLKRLR